MAGFIRQRNGNFYIRIGMRVIDPKTGESRWKEVEKKVGTSKRQAQKALKDLQGDVESGAYVPTNMTVLQLGQKWLREHVQPNLKPGAAVDCRSVLYRHIAPALGHLRVDDCKPEHVQALLGSKREHGLSEATVSKIRRHLHAIFAFAIEQRLLTVNPATASRRRGAKPRRKERGTALTPIQVKRLLDECSPRCGPSSPSRSTLACAGAS
jgi:hypothetical protein